MSLTGNGYGIDVEIVATTSPRLMQRTVGCDIYHLPGDHGRQHLKDGSSSHGTFSILHLRCMSCQDQATTRCVLFAATLFATVLAHLILGHTLMDA